VEAIDIQIINVVWFISFTLEKRAPVGRPPGIVFLTRNNARCAGDFPRKTGFPMIGPGYGYAGLKNYLNEPV
jgi:hypothetical protein